MAEQKKFDIGEFLHRNLVWILAFIAFILWYTKKPDVPAGRVISSDTTRTQVLQPIVVNPAYQPQQSGATVYVPTPQQYQQVVPASTMEALIEQVKELSSTRESLYKDYSAQKTYKDSIQLKDTAGNRVGVVNLTQLVSENTLKSTQSSYQLAFPLTTIKNTVAQKLKNQWFTGVSVQSPIQIPSVQQVNMGILVKNKKENILSLSGTYNIKTQQPGVQVGYYQKISFKSPVSKLLFP